MVQGFFILAMYSCHFFSKISRVPIKLHIINKNVKPSTKQKPKDFWGTNTAENREAYNMNGIGYLPLCYSRTNIGVPADINAYKSKAQG